MENASKALIIAGSVLIALLVISLLVMFYNNIREYQATNYNADVAEQIAEFNKQYDVYYRDNLYGSDILSIANKVVDYNKRESDTEGYSKLETEVTFKTSLSAYNGEQIINSKQKYTAAEMQERAEYLSNKVSEYGDKTYSRKKVSALSGMRTNELEDLVGKDNLSVVQNDINYYLGYKSALTTLKSRIFKATEFTYDKGTARIKLMKFEEE